MQHKQTIRARLTGQPAARIGRYQVLFIQAGEANGWSFPEQALRESAALWENVSVFVDHAMFGRSVRDLGGVLSNVAYSTELNGLTAELTPCGPSAEIVHEAARVMLDEGHAHPHMGFSADVIFTAGAANNVERIMQPLSVDLVIDPAFATRFIRQLNSTGRGGLQLPAAAPAARPAGEGATMSRNANPPAAEAADPTLPQEERTRAPAPLGEILKAQQLEASKQLVRLALANADLPEPAASEIRSRFEGTVVDPGELNAAVEAYQKTLAALSAPGEIKGPARASGMFDSRDQFQAAVDDLLGAPREQGAESLRVARLSGIREAYLMLTGDRDFTGGYFRDRAQLQHTTATFPGLVVNAMNKALADRWQQLGRAGYDWWQKIATVEHFDTLNQITWLVSGTIASLPSVSEGAEYPELHIGDSHEHSDFIKYGGYVGITLEALDRDDTRRLRAIPRELANAGLRNISSLVAAIFTQASGAGPTLTDTGALFNSTAITTRGGHLNLLTTALGTDYTAWNAVALAMFNQPMLVADETGYTGTGKKCAVWPKYCLVPGALKAQADALFMPRWQSEVDAIASAGGPSWGGRVEVVTVPEWTDATDWAAAQDPAIMPGVMIGERFGLMPQIFLAGSETDPAMFANDESRIKVRHLVAVGVADFRPLHKSNVGG